MPPSYTSLTSALLLSTHFAICLASPFSSTPAPASNSTHNLTSLHFDDIRKPPSYPHPLFPPPNPYADLFFAGFSVFDPHDPVLKYFIPPADKNCAVSRPYALLGGQRGGSRGGRPVIEMSGGKKGSKGGWQSFDLFGMMMKPLSAPPGDEEIRVTVRAWKARNCTSERRDEMYGKSGSIETGEEEMLTWFVDFPVGYHLPFNASFPVEWKALRKAEMYAEYGVQKLDWEFCVDDLRVRFNRDDEGEDEDKEVAASRDDEIREPESTGIVYMIGDAQVVLRS